MMTYFGSLLVDISVLSASNFVYLKVKYCCFNYRCNLIYSFVKTRKKKQQ